jgi:hypothetical protein
MVLKIERIAQGRATVLRLSGRIQSEHLDQLKGQIEIIKEHVILDLEEVNLVDSDVVWFLAICEDKGVKLGLCPLYIREWINREKARASDHPKEIHARQWRVCRSGAVTSRR